MAQVLQRPPRENITPLVLEQTVWAGANLGSYQQAVVALEKLSEISLAPKQVQRVTRQIGADCVAERKRRVDRHRRRPLMQKTTAKPGVPAPELAVVMMDGGRFQRRDHFRARKDSPSGTTDSARLDTASQKTTHWREDKVGLVLSMTSQEHASDPAPDFPEWLAGAQVVADIAQLAAREERAEDEEPSAQTSVDALDSAPTPDASHETRHWPDLAPRLVSRDVIASSESAEAFGHHLEWKAWERGIQGAPRQAFVADGLAANWTIHKRHFSQTTGILDLMHALSYAWRAAAGLADPRAYRRYATWIWQGQVSQVIAELQEHQARLGLPEPDTPASDPRQRIDRAITYYTNHAHRMQYPLYRQLGLPLTSSLMESAIKQINARVKGTEKFWNETSGESILQLRSDSLSDSQPLDPFWQRWRTRQTGTNTYRKTVA